MKSYSLDLRRQIVKARVQDKISLAKIAERYDVSLSTVKNYIKLHNATGDVHPRPHGGGYPSKVTPEAMADIIDRLRKKPKLTLKQLCGILRVHHGIQVSEVAIWRRLSKLGHIAEEGERVSAG